jgi:serine/threonine protein kinase
MENLTLEKAIAILAKAKSPEEVFGKLSGVKTTHQEFVKIYRRYVVATHPDLNTKNFQKASEAFVVLEKWKVEAESKIKYNAYGIEKPKESIILKSQKEQYSLDDLIFKGDLCDIYRAVDSNGHLVAVKINRVPINNDLLQNEFVNFRRIHMSQVGSDVIAQHVIKPLDSFDITHKGCNLKVNVAPYYSDCFTLEQVLNKYPNGISSASMVWMWNRILAGLMVIHESNIVHGAILPCHILINPKTHNGHIIDGCYSADVTRSLRAIVPKYKDLYPQEVFAKKSYFSTDLYMLALCMLKLIAGKNLSVTKNTEAVLAKLPKPLRGIFRYCLLGSPMKRPNSAWHLYGDLKEILLEAFGPPKFVKFEM